MAGPARPTTTTSASSARSKRFIPVPFQTSGGDEDLALVARGAPRDGEPLRDLEDHEQDDADDRHRDERREQLRRVEVAVGAHDDVAQPRVRADELAHDRTDDRERSGGLEPGESV